MILENKGATLKITYDGQTFDIPEGKFEVEAELGNHIIACSAGWPLVNIVIVDGNKREVIKPAIDPIEAPIEAPEAPEAPVEDDQSEEAHEEEVKE